MLTTYLLKKDSFDNLLLYDKQGQRVPVLQLLDVVGNRRVFAFYGSMGAGKTTLLKYLCETMGTQDVVNSPTFAIVNVYELNGEAAARYGNEIYHFDCYRLKDVREARDFGAEEYIYSGNYCFIEWPEMIDSLLPEDVVSLTIKVLENGDRQITLE